MTQNRAPDLDGALRWWRAFFALTTCRPRGPAFADPIPWWAVEAYARRHGYDEEEYEDLCHYVAALDDLWLRHRLEQAGGTAVG